MTSEVDAILKFKDLEERLQEVGLVLTPIESGSVELIWNFRLSSGGEPICSFKDLDHAEYFLEGYTCAVSRFNIKNKDQFTPEELKVLDELMTNRLNSKNGEQHNQELDLCAEVNKPVDTIICTRNEFYSHIDKYNLEDPLDIIDSSGVESYHFNGKLIGMIKHLDGQPKQYHIVK